MADREILATLPKFMGEQIVPEDDGKEFAIPSTNATAIGWRLRSDTSDNRTNII